MNRLRDKRLFSVGVFATTLGCALGVAIVRLGFTKSVAVIGGAGTAAIAVVIATIAVQFYDRWFPELERFSEPERRKALRGATPYGLLLTWVVVFVSLSWCAIPILKWLQRSGGTIPLVLGLAATWSTPVLLAVWVVRNPIRRGLRRQLATNGLPICVQCGYDTRELTEPRCPECGHPLPS